MGFYGQEYWSGWPFTSGPGLSVLGAYIYVLLLPDLHICFSRGRSGGLVFPSLSEFSTVYCDPHSQGFGIVSKAEIDVFLELLIFR